MNENIVYTFNIHTELKDIYDLDDSQNFDFNGCYYGIGINLKSKDVFITFNGRILNGLSY